MDYSITPNIDVMLRGFLHEIRNPLSAVLTAATLLRDPALLEEEEFSDLVQMIEEESRHMNEVIKAFDHYVHLRQPVLESLDLAQLTREAAEQLRATDGAENVQITASVPATLTIQGDATLLGEALNAVLLNALQAAQESSAANPQIHVSLKETDSDAMLQVCDSGEGFGDQALRRAFEPFFSTRAGACGLGLPTAFAILQTHRGSLHIVQPRGEQGTCVQLQWPLG